MPINNSIDKPEALQPEEIAIYGAREHNLKDIDIRFPRNQLIVITGISGSGKSSLAFDTIYAEGQRRYMESFSAYARTFIGNMERPDVDKIEGLSPVIAIEQKTSSRNPRSTVGTSTEIYDFMRLLFARAGEAFSYVTGNKMRKQTEEQIIEQLLSQFSGEKLILLSPVVKGRKGHYRELFEQVRKMGYNKVRIDGLITDLAPKMQLDRYKVHDIEIVIDRIKVKQKERARLAQSVKEALKHGKGILIALSFTDKNKEILTYCSKFLMDPIAGIAYDEPAPNLFSFNSPYGACLRCHGLGKIAEITKELFIQDQRLSLAKGAIPILLKQRYSKFLSLCEKMLLIPNKCSLHTPLKDIPKRLIAYIFYGNKEKLFETTDYFFNLPFSGLIDWLKQEMQRSGKEASKALTNEFGIVRTCPDCRGMRLKKEALHFKINGKNIAELAGLTLDRLAQWFIDVVKELSPQQLRIAEQVLKEINKRINFLLSIGLSYLTLSRPLTTLSGGESQRIRLATQIGTQLVNVLYILDEPSIGLHQRDNEKLTQALKALRDLGNSIIVVEHDKEIMLASDYIIDIGPGAGVQGGEVVAVGTPATFIKQKSLTAAYLKGEKTIAIPAKRREGNGRYLTLKNASGYNLKNITVAFPLEKIICVTGVSGSGKSSLVYQTLYPILNRHCYRSKKIPLPYEKITGLAYIDKVIQIDQLPIGRTPRSNPATYTGVFTDIRLLFTAIPEAKIMGYKPGRFSFNVKGGRCETCQGGGKKLIEMDFLPNVHIDCEICRGERYNREALEIRFKGKSIADVLDMTVTQACLFFENQPKIRTKLDTLASVGLTYIKLGQHATTLSGGEAQRVKLATELSKKDTGKTFYILDEPTTGLHFQDITYLLSVLNRLVDKGNTVLIIEHNIDIINAADYIIDLGPGGGDSGGYVVCTGTPEEIAATERGYTGKYLQGLAKAS